MSKTTYIVASAPVGCSTIALEFATEAEALAACIREADDRVRNAGEGATIDRGEDGVTRIRLRDEAHERLVAKRGTIGFPRPTYEIAPATAEARRSADRTRDLQRDSLRSHDADRHGALR
mgnify:CR=1 FL=1